MSRRLLAACLLGFILVILSGLLHTAIAAGLAGGWRYAWVAWTIAGLLAALIAFGAKTERDAWAWLCLVNAAVSIGVLVAVLVLALTGSAATVPDAAPLPEPLPDAAIPTASAFRFAVASGLLGFVVTVLAAGFLVAAYLLMRGRDHPPHR
ncbi:hypothetical protein [Inquilinus limosus]|uniref:hypothetical protein n=1 Tax=Inquilinus limosus TaxID=171674 RepID=UPI00047ECE69|nr:hypothetical protein [Inquilinus limosus]